MEKGTLPLLEEKKKKRKSEVGSGHSEVRWENCVVSLSLCNLACPFVTTTSWAFTGAPLPAVS